MRDAYTCASVTWLPSGTGQRLDAVVLSSASFVHHFSVALQGTDFAWAGQPRMSLNFTSRSVTCVRVPLYWAFKPLYKTHNIYTQMQKYTEDNSTKNILKWKQ